MRHIGIAISFVILSCSAYAQTAAPTPTDRNRATHFSAESLQAALAKLPTDRPNAAVRVFTLDPYNVGVEQRQPRAQGAASHADRAELFYVIDGTGTMLTGGTIPDGKASGVNTQGTTINGGTRIDFKKGDFIMVPSGVPHQFVDLKAPVQVMSMYLPDK
ncbi:MAG: cupin domain-containing protein [Vicinamibacterales bacterium]|jgi:mannose-6-phosphate isomerase-like protein (cupin superfamily)